MSSGTLFRATALSLLSLLLINLAMVPWSHRLPYRRKLDQIRDAQHPNLVFIGDSLLDTRVSEAALDIGARPAGIFFHPLDAALGGTAPPDHALLANYSVTVHPEIRTMVIGVLDFLLTRNDRYEPMTMTGTRELGFDSVFDVSMISRLNGWNVFQRTELRVLRFFPMIIHRKSAWRYVEVLRRSLAQIGMPKEATNSFGRLADLAILESPSTAAFDRQAEPFIQRSIGFNASYTEVFRLAQQHHVKVVLVVMPTSIKHAQEFYKRPSWTAYLQRVNTLADQQGFDIVDASEWIKDQALFLDGVHLSPAGAIQFNILLGDYLAKHTSN